MVLRLPLLVALLMPTLSFSAEPEAKAAFVTRAWVLSTGTQGILPEAESTDEEGILQDVREFLKEEEIEFPANGEAWYDSKRGTLTVRAPADVVRKIDEYVEHGHEMPVGCRWGFQLVEFTMGLDATEGFGMTYEELKRLAGDSWKVVDRLVIFGQQGSSASAGIVKGQTTPQKKATAPSSTSELPFEPGQYGSRASAEASTSGNRRVMPVSFSYHFRARSDDKQSGGMEISATQTQYVRNGVPKIVQIMTAAPGRGIALIIELSLVDERGNPLRKGLTTKANPR